MALNKVAGPRGERWASSMPWDGLKLPLASGCWYSGAISNRPIRSVMLPRAYYNPMTSRLRCDSHVNSRHANGCEHDRAPRSKGPLSVNAPQPTPESPAADPATIPVSPAVPVRG